MKRIVKKALTIQPGDILRVEVPVPKALSKIIPWAHRLMAQKYYLDAGIRHLYVQKSLAAKPHFKRYRVVWSDREFVVSVPIDKKFAGYLFMGRDTHPVMFTFIPNLALRLKTSKGAPQRESKTKHPK